MPETESTADTSLDGVSVLIVTNRSVEVLLEAIQTIEEQDFRGPTQVVVVGDNPSWRPTDLPERLRSGAGVESLCILSNVAVRELPTVERVARLRNIALTFAREKYLCFLDDDNSWRSDHLCSLMDTLRASDASAAHSWRQLVDEDSVPWVPDRFPWGQDPLRSAELYRHFTAAGVIDPHSNLFRDKLGLEMNGEIVDAVDMGAWLFQRQLFDFMRFETDYTPWEIANSITEDDKLLSTIRREGITVACSEMPTLIYRLGGYSNKAKARQS